MADPKAEDALSGTPAKKSHGPLAILIVLTILGVQSVAAYHLVMRYVIPTSLREAASETEKRLHEERELESTVIYPIEKLVVNPAGTAGTRYLNVTVGIEVANEEILSKLEKMDIQLRDILIDVFTSKTIPELDSPADRDILRQQIADQIRPIVKDSLVNVFFSDFVLQ